MCFKFILVLSLSFYYWLSGLLCYCKMSVQKPSSEENKDECSNEFGAVNKSDSPPPKNDVEVTTLADLFAKLQGHFTKEKEKHEQLLGELTIKGVADYILSNKCKKIIVMTGAGISTSAGIPDFRSPGTGLYSQLEKYNLPHPQSIFELDYFKQNPEPFFLLARELWPGNYKPTISHFFLYLLEKKKLLLRNFTQNIDGLELVAGLSPEHLIPAHGTFHTSHCLECRAVYTAEWVKKIVFEKKIPKCEKKGCDGVVKPDIVFFGESLPKDFFTHMTSDFPQADLLIIMGTSLLVQPFCRLVDNVKETVPRLLINREKCGVGRYGFGLDFDSEDKYRDVAHLGDCDEGCLKLAELLGWKEELLNLAKEYKAE